MSKDSTLHSRHEVTEGQVLAGKYRVERVLGEGGMGVVVAARHLQLDERVALKFMREEALVSSEAVARFAREARAAVKIKSEHVARVSDVGTLENGAPYMVMEHLEGSDLSSWLDERGRLPVEQAVEFVLQASEAIAEAHALGIVHRDLKPSNLFVIRRPDGALSVKVLDFGISKMTGAAGSSSPDFNMTKTTAVMGSPNYMSPEQMRSVKQADARSDIWALGVILYELLAGGPPFVAEEFPELVLKIAAEPPEPLRNRAPDAPLGIEKVILKCLEKDPGKRYATVGELALALVEFGPRRSRLSVERISGVLKAAGMSQSAMALPPSSEFGAPVDAGTAASFGRTASGSTSSKLALLVSAAALVVGGLIGARYGLRDRAAAATPTVEHAALVPAAVSVVPVAAPARAAAPIEIAAAPAAPSAAAAPAAAPSIAASPPSPPKPPATPLPRAGTTKAQPARATPPAPAKPVAVPAPVPKKPNVFDDR